MSCRDAWYAGDRFDSVLLMRAVVIYESMFGDAAKVARSIGAGLADVWGGQVDEVTVVEVGEAQTTIPDDVDLLVVGSPTHAFGLPRPSTRADAAAKNAREVISARIGIREWLDAATLAKGQAAAAFDTRMDHPKTLTKLDHASRTTEKHLRKLGASLVSPAEHFFVVDTTGPLVAGEVERARAWGTTLAGKVAE